MITPKDLFFISSVWNTGTGFLIKDYNYIITTIQVVGFAKKVVVRNSEIGKKIAKVIFIDYSNGLVFIELPRENLSSLNILNLELSVVEQPIKLYRTNYYGTILKENGEITDNKFKHNNFNHLNLKFNNKLLKVSGALLLTNRNEIAGITKYIKEENLFVGLPSKYILKSLEEFSIIDQSSIRCPNCLNIINKKRIINNVCPSCTTNIKKELLEDYIPQMSVFENNIEKTITNLGYDIECSRLGRNFWEIEEGSAKIFVRYDPKQKFIAAFSELSDLVYESYSDIFNFLLVENNKLDSLSFSLHNKRIFLSASYLFEDDFNEQYAQEVFHELLNKADYYDDIINKMIKDYKKR